MCVLCVWVSMCEVSRNAAKNSSVAKVNRKKNVWEQKIHALHKRELNFLNEKRNRTATVATDTTTSAHLYDAFHIQSSSLAAYKNVI